MDEVSLLKKKTTRKTKAKKVNQRSTPIEKLSAIKLNLKKIALLYKQGWTDEQVAVFLGVSKRTVQRWSNKSKELSTLKKEWKEEADIKVEKSLYQRALGYKFDETTQEVRDGELKITKITTKEIAADTTACIFWLKNRKPVEWRDRQEIDIKTYKHETFKEVSDEELEKEALEIANRITKRRTKASVN